MVLCACGCGQEVIQKYSWYICRYINGHNSLGKYHSEETKRKISQSHKGMLASEETKKKLSESHKDKKHTEETKKKMSESRRGKKHYNYGKHLSEEQKKKISESRIGEKHPNYGKRGEQCPMYGKHHSEEYKKRMSEIMRGEKNPSWQGGISFEPYCEKFNNQKKEEIRNQYDRKCYICHKHENDNITKTGKQEKLCVHHIDLDKEQGCNGKQWKLVPVCRKCHAKIHKDKILRF